MNKRFKIEPYIRYANCYEDAETLLKIIGNSENALSIASGGDNSLALLTVPSLKNLTVFDRNPAQLSLTKLKFAAFKHLEYDEVLALLGISNGDSIAVYNKLRSKLYTETKEFFDERLSLVSKIGIVNCGKFEYYLNRIRKSVIRFTQSKKKLARFMNMAVDGQKDFYLNKINNRRWRIVTKRFFSQKTVEKLGRDRAAFAYAHTDLYDMITKRLLLCFDNVSNQENTYLQYTVYGRFTKLPFYLRKENFKAIKTNIDKAQFVLGDIEAVVATGKRFDFFNLSDIFEYMDEAELKQNEKMIADMSFSDAVVVFWNALVDRQFASGDFISADKSTVYEIYKNEKAYYYQALRIYERNKFAQ